jgi:hypothetical protein
MATKKDWQGYYNVLKEVEFKEEEFTYIILFSFINMYYPNVDIQKLQYSEEIENFQDALENVLKNAIVWDKNKKKVLKVIR